MQPDGVHLFYFKLKILDLKELIVWNIIELQYWGPMCKDIGIKKSAFVAKTQFLSPGHPKDGLYLNHW